ncbi:MAG: integrase [Desulfobacteraceae bacterium]|nr:integrase [Desulfobacteraceae bacterium]
MAVYVECPVCHRKQSLRNRVCGGCDWDLVKAKRTQSPNYWVQYYIAGKQARFELVGKSIQEARELDIERKKQKRENTLSTNSKINFLELSRWYLNLNSVKKLKSYDRVQLCLKNFNKNFKHRKVGSIKNLDLIDYQNKRLDEGRALATVDMELKIVQTMVSLAFDNDIIGEGALKAFRKTKKLLVKGKNARKKIIKISEYIKLVNAALSHLKPIIIVAMNTGMRAGEIRNLKWSHIQGDFIRFDSEDVKEKDKKSIPINQIVNDILQNTASHDHHDYIFTYRNKPITDRSGFRKSWKTTCKKAGLVPGRLHPMGIIFHDIRRSVKTYMIEAGVDPVHRDMILGHSLQGMDVHYAVQSDDALMDAMNRYEKWLTVKIAMVAGPAVKKDAS